MKKFIKTIIIVLVIILVVAFIAFFANSLFGNPISKHLAKNTAIEYIEDNYPDDDCHIKYINYDFKYENYNAHIISTTNENIDFSLNITPKGEVAGIEYWKNPKLEETATPLTEDEIEDLFTNANILYYNWLGSVNNIEVDWNNTVTVGGVEYFAVNSTKITSVDALKSSFSKYFAKEVYDNKIDELYIMHNGKMYGNCILAEGGDISWENHKLIVNNNTDNLCTFTVTSYFEDDERELNYTLKVIDGKWKFTDVFNYVSFNNNLELL